MKICHMRRRKEIKHARIVVRAIISNSTSLNYHLQTHTVVTELVCEKSDKSCQSPTQPQLELEPDLIMGRKPPTPPILLS